MKLWSAFAGVLFVLISSPASAVAGLHVVDLTGDFDRFAMSTRQMPDGERLAAFEQQIGPIADGFYMRGRMTGDYDSRVLVELKNYPERRNGNLVVSKEFNELFAPARRKFEAVFGPVTSTQPVFLIDSMGELDGGTRQLNGKSTLLFGADVIWEAHAGKTLTPFFQHELFHVYHENMVTSCAALWCALWEEGLATYVASRLNPGADDAALSLDKPQAIRPAVEADRARAVCAVVRRLESVTDEDYAGLFLANFHLAGFPPRMGYYIGYLVAQDIGRTHDLHSMAKMSWVEAKPLIDASLARMATCPTATAEDRERSRNYRFGG